MEVKDSPVHWISAEGGWCNVLGSPMTPILAKDRLAGWTCTCGRQYHRETRYSDELRPRFGDLWSRGKLVERGSEIEKER